MHSAEYFIRFNEKNTSLPLKLEERSWRQLAVKLASNYIKAQHGQLEPKFVTDYVQAILHKANIDDGYYLEDRSGAAANDASGQT